MTSDITLRNGTTGSQVHDWQAALNELGFRDNDGNPLVEDGVFGNRTFEATVQFQNATGFPTNGVVSTAMIVASAMLLSKNQVKSEYEFIPCRNFTVANRTAIDLVVFHTMEAQEKPGTARGIAKWGASDAAPKASWHWAADNKEAIMCVREKDIAWHAPGANNNGIGVEHAGFASQTAEQWADDYSTDMLKVSARLVAQICKRWSIPIVWLEADDVRAKQRGITGHKQVADAFKASDHWDPGPAFPHDLYIALVRNEFVKLT